LASKTADAGIDALGGVDALAGVDVQGSDLTPTKDAAFADQPGDSAPMDTAADTPQPPDAANDTQTDATADSGADSKGDGAVLDTAVAEFALLSADPTDGASNIAQDAVLTWTFSAPVKAESAVT
jgi:hypothetical protein